MSDPPLAPELRHLLRDKGLDPLELEFRLGHPSPAGFRAGVSPAAWELLRATLEARHGAPPLVREWTDHLDPRTGCRYDPDGKLANYKQKVCHRDLPPPKGCWATRGALALESWTAAPQRPAGDFPYWRRKRRWSFRHKCWSYDLTITRTNTPEQIDNDADTHEVEIELADKSVLFARPLDNVVRWGWDLAAEIAELAAGAG